MEDLIIPTSSPTQYDPAEGLKKQEDFITRQPRTSLNGNLPKDDENLMADEATEAKLCCYRCMPFYQRYPRFSSFVLGAILPLWTIVLICGLFGLFLSMAEGNPSATINIMLFNVHYDVSLMLLFYQLIASWSFQQS
jgi:hypothetical protein